MELRQLETFQEVMITLNMTVAAKRICVSPATVSLQIRQLSGELGADLFTRVGHRLVPTLAAERLQQRLGPLVDGLRALHEDFPLGSQHDTGRFVLATGLTILMYQLRRPLSELCRKFSHNEIQVHIGRTESIVQDLELRRIDLGIVSLPVKSPNVLLTPLFKEEMLVLMNTRAAAHLHGKSISLKDLSSLPMIIYPPGTNTRAIIDRMLQSHGISLRVKMELDNTEAIKKLVEAGFGASILPQEALRKCPLIRTFRIQEEHLCREVALATTQSAYPRKLTTTISEYLKQRLGDRLQK